MITVKRITALWCMSCLIMKKTWDNVFKNFPEINLVDYDFDDDYKVVETLNIGDILPVLIIYKDDIEVQRIVGEKKEKQLNEIFFKLNL
ncbi:MAG: thioredoxin family protein [Candidatus Izemoplasmatales bacterium]|jgi:thiol-disulfide isomerase/thioredoxin